MMSDESEGKGSNHVVIEMAKLSTEEKEEECDKPEASKTAKVAVATPSPSSAPPTQTHSQSHLLSEVPWTTSSVLSRTQRDEQFDQEMLRRAIADTGRWAFGTISVEAWILDEDTGKLVRPQRAFWFDPVAVRENQDNESMMRLVDDSREDFVKPDPLAPGIGLAGALWSELSPTVTHRRNGTMMRMSRMSVFDNGGIFDNPLGDAIMPNRNVAWREVAPIVRDPDQPYNLRLQLAEEAGIGLAAGVKYHFRGTQGLVVYMARSTTDITKLKSEVNEQYLLSAADVIGSIVALRGPRQFCLEERRVDRESVRRRVRQKMVAVIRIGGSFLTDSLQKNYEAGHPNAPKLSGKTPGGLKQSLEDAEAAAGGWKKTEHFLITRLKLIATKWKGANNAPPPPFSTREAIWTFFGSFLSLLMLLNFSDAITKINPDYSMVMGPFGALMTLQYSLTAAPASQPRNAIFGQIISMSIAIGMTYATRLPVNLRKSLGTSLAIMCMARFGCIHPPAGATALIFTGGKYSWTHMAIMLVGNVLAIFSATIINDLNVRRQYPTFWGFGYWRNHFFNGNEKTKSA